MKVQVERKDGDAWKQVRVQASYSRNENYWFKLDGYIYVFKDLREGTDVVTKTAKGWEKAGSVVRGLVFLGPGKSFSETMDEQAQKNPLWTKPIFA
jgi:hypothetical protein